MNENEISIEIDQWLVKSINISEIKEIIQIENHVRLVNFETLGDQLKIIDSL